MGRDARPFWHRMTGRFSATVSFQYCQWIEGEPTANDGCKCLRAVLPGTAYCPEHLRRVYRQVEPDNDN